VEAQHGGGCPGIRTLGHSRPLLEAAADEAAPLSPVATDLWDALVPVPLATPSPPDADGAETTRVSGEAGAGSAAQAPAGTQPGQAAGGGGGGGAQAPLQSWQLAELQATDDPVEAAGWLADIAIDMLAEIQHACARLQRLACVIQAEPQLRAQVLGAYRRICRLHAARAWIVMTQAGTAVSALSPFLS
jgi:hypothetical protein